MIACRGYRLSDRRCFSRSVLEGEFISAPTAEFQTRLSDDPSDGDRVFLDHLTMSRDGEPVALVRIEGDPHRSIGSVAIRLAHDLDAEELADGVRAVLDYLRMVRSFDYVVAYSSAAPPSRSTALLRKFGFSVLGAIPNHFYHDGRYFPAEVWGKQLSEGNS